MPRINIPGTWASTTMEKKASSTQSWTTTRRRIQDQHTRTNGSDTIAANVPATLSCLWLQTRSSDAVIDTRGPYQTFGSGDVEMLAALRGHVVNPGPASVFGSCMPGAGHILVDQPTRRGASAHCLLCHRGGCPIFLASRHPAGIAMVPD